MNNYHNLSDAQKLVEAIDGVVRETSLTAPGNAMLLLTCAVLNGLYSRGHPGMSDDAANFAVKVAQKAFAKLYPGSVL